MCVDRHPDAYLFPTPGFAGVEENFVCRRKRSGASRQNRVVETVVGCFGALAMILSDSNHS